MPSRAISAARCIACGWTESTFVVVFYEVMVDRDADVSAPAAYWGMGISRSGGGAEQDRRTIGSRFVVSDGLVSKYARHDTGLADALASAGLAVDDEVTHRGQLTR